MGKCKAHPHHHSNNIKRENADKIYKEGPEDILLCNLPPVCDPHVFICKQKRHVREEGERGHVNADPFGSFRGKQKNVRGEWGGGGGGRTTGFIQRVQAAAERTV